MVDQNQVDYLRVEKAIRYIRSHVKDQPSLESVAAAVHLSPFHFQRLFSEWAGVSPKKFMQYLSLTHAKQLLRQRKSTLLEAAYQTGLSSAGRLHDLFVTIEGMTPGEYKRGGDGLLLRYHFAPSPFGKVVLASTPKGLCYMAFEDDENRALHDLRRQFPKATYRRESDSVQRSALRVFSHDRQQLDSVKLHLAGTPFQLKVWESLLKIPWGTVASYGDVAQAVGSPGSARAVGSAVGKNPVAFLIPCHRVIRSSGTIGEYAWNPARKSAMIGWEAAHGDRQDRRGAVR